MAIAHTHLNLEDFYFEHSTGLVNRATSLSASVRSDIDQIGRTIHDSLQMLESIRSDRKRLDCDYQEHCDKVTEIQAEIQHQLDNLDKMIHKLKEKHIIVQYNRKWDRNK